MCDQDDEEHHHGGAPEDEGHDHGTRESRSGNARSAGLEDVVERLREVNDRLGQMTRAVESRDVIGQAKGILMERYGLTADKAFALLLSASNNSQARLGQVATALVTDGRLPDIAGG